MLIAAFALITACMIYLIKEGVSLRLGRVIEPTLLSLGEVGIAHGLIGRLTPIFQPSRFVVFGIDKEDEQVQAILRSLETEFKKDFLKSPNFSTSESDFVKDCPAPCWIIAAPGESTHLEPSELIEKLKQTGETFFTISVLRFDRKAEVPQHCESEKRISIDCVTPLAVREARRKFKEDSPYFFVSSYNERDYFLFLEN